ncbi:bifunctional 2-dehydro-3-deoxygluconokinase/2-dehydro-3-deoxygalactonokinase [Halorientalis brevis]|uniref:Bifunctional 2-dehydro-3-deoxygluconokinase/2-dehydro-3-deoxygalactonokinase n=1 Tax=Halorientalis brevis TaxID=1126241 RepID=A0ABD6C676_9EURY|nr:bifunctional 2-dehydro-3-deoxygluconokinase/2-dehydro-3-deoxygalactonokinase [Halorientalis brevis]
MPDLVTFGETMLRLSPPGDTPIETADSFDVHAAGAESNVAAAAARLGADAAWLSKLPDSPPGRRVTGALRRHGVEPAVVWTDDGRQGTYYLESGDQPRGATVVYDRDHAAVRTATPDELATDRVESASVFHTTGITPALSDTLARTTGDLLTLAREAGTTTTFDLNYRSKLWEPAEARETLTDLFPHVDVLVVAERDAETVLGLSGPADEQARHLAGEYDFQTTIVTTGSEGVVALHDGELLEQPAFTAGDSHPVGTGDAFVGGYLAKRLQDGTVADALTYGAATAALKRTIPGDVAVVTPAAVDRVVAGDDTDISR